MFKKAEKIAIPLKMALSGPSGSGKTFTALEIMSHLTDKIAFLDTESQSALMYADEFNFDHAILDGNYSLEKYTKAIQEAEKLGYGGIILDSVSHGWNDAGGALDRVEAGTSKLRGNSYAAWKDVTPSIRDFLNQIVRAKIHVIACFRVKTEYVDVERNGKKYKEKVGLAPVFKEGSEHEFHLVATMDLNHNLVIEKIRQGTSDYLDDSIQYNKPDSKFADKLKRWLALAPEENIKLAKAVKNTKSLKDFSDDVNKVINSAETVKKPIKTPVEVNIPIEEEKRPQTSANDEKQQKETMPQADAPILNENIELISDEQRKGIAIFCKSNSIATSTAKAILRKEGYISTSEIPVVELDRIMGLLEEVANG